eukprot:TRINITY_DN2532_c0_g3_i1.p1 TRINITY_DN2532_c0_g3~~TRINITY_DN2532_c0_g3_i1.p1  ORF type:complete len:721 (+),score=154.58 TRINITY_DN2532_c0_g3_i1:83-2245(+)
MFASRTSLGSAGKRAPTPPGTDGGSTNATDDVQDRKTGAFAEQLNCAVCNAALGKRKMNPRHHCRICGNSVCASCSPSSLQLEGERSLQRACTPCVSNAQKASLHRDKLVRLGENLNAISGETGPVDDPPESIDDALVRCEGILTALEDQRDDLVATKTQLDGVKRHYETSKAALEETEAKLREESEARERVAKDSETSRNQLAEMETKIKATEDKLSREESLRQESIAAREEARANFDVKLAEEHQRRLDLEKKLTKFEASEARASEAEARVIEVQRAHDASIAKWKSEVESCQKMADTSQAHVKEADARAAEKKQAFEQVETKMVQFRKRYEFAEVRVNELEAQVLLQKQELEMTGSRLDHEQKTRELVDMALSDLRKEHAAVEAQTAQEKERVVKELEVISQDFHGMKESAEALKSQLEESRGGERVLQSRCERLAADLEDEKQSRLKLENMVQAAKSSSMDDKSSSAEALRSCQAALALAESNVTREVRARKQAEEALDLAKSANIKLGERLWAAATPVGESDAGSRQTIPTSLEEAVVFCQSALPLIEQVQRKFPEIQQRLVAAEASRERQKLEQETAERQCRASSADVKAALERQQRVEADVERERHQREVAERQLRDSSAQIKSALDRLQRESAEWTAREAVMEADLAREREQRQILERNLRGVEHARERSPVSDPAQTAMRSRNLADLHDQLLSPPANQAGEGRCTDRCSLM